MGSYGTTPPPCLGSGEVNGRYDRPKPLPWYFTNQTAVMLCVAAIAALILGLGAIFG